ncbi:MAG: glycoside hydrolase family 105 protein [Haloarculaceae archaeon]
MPESLDSLDTITERVAEHTAERDMEGEDWEKAVAINGLVATGEERFVDAARRLVDRSVETQTAAGQFTYGSLDYKPWLEQAHIDSFKGVSDPAAVGQGVVDFYERTSETRYIDAARRQYEFLKDAPKTEDGGITHRREDVELWVDSIYMQCPFFARYAAAADHPEAYDDAVRQIRVCAKHLQDPRTGLFRHAWKETPDSYPSGTFWNRGNGWAAAGIVDTLERLPDGHEGRDDLVRIFRDLAEATVERQDDSGFWHHLLDDPETSLETSGTLMLSYAFKKGADMGLLESDRYVTAAEDGLEVCLPLVDDDGRVHRVSKPPGGPKMPMGVTSYGQGWFLLAASLFDE